MLCRVYVAFYLFLVHVLWAYVAAGSHAVEAQVRYNNMTGCRSCRKIFLWKCFQCVYRDWPYHPKILWGLQIMIKQWSEIEFILSKIGFKMITWMGKAAMIVSTPNDQFFKNFRALMLYPSCFNELILNCQGDVELIFTQTGSTRDVPLTLRSWSSQHI